MKIKTNNLITGILFIALLSGCAAAVVGGAAVVAHDRRSTGAVIDDQGIELLVKNAIYQDPVIDNDDHIKVTSYNGVVLLVGETTSEENFQQAAALAGGVNGVKRVVNELAVQPETGVGTRLDDSYLTAKVNTYLLTKNPIPGFDPTRINVVTVRDTVYLMGRVTREEGDNVAEVVRNVNGVAKVVKVFDYMD